MLAVSWWCRLPAVVWCFVIVLIAVWWLRAGCFVWFAVVVFLFTDGLGIVGWLLIVLWFTF